MLTSAELSSMQTTVSESLPDTMQIIHRTLSADSLGGSTASWSTPISVSARLGLATSSSSPERAVAGAEMSIGSWRITLPAFTDVSQTDRILFGSRTFEILDVSTVHSFELSTVAQCEEVL